MQHVLHRRPGGTVCRVDRGPGLKQESVQHTRRKSKHFFSIRSSATDHVEVLLVKAADNEEQVPAQLAEELLPAHVFCKPLDHVALRQEVPLAEDLLQTGANVSVLQSRQYAHIVSPTR